MAEIKEFFFARKRWYDADEVDMLLQKLRENNQKVYDKQAEDWNRLCMKYNKLIELKKEFCEKFKDIELEIDK